VTQNQSPPRPGATIGALAALPLFLATLSLFLFLAFQTFQTVRDRESLSTLRAGQEPTLQEAIKLRQQLESLAGKTAQLALEGDEGAKTVAADMKRQGVTLSPPKQ
jgi:hypothetical protein